ncbi:MAG TPA: hypothetical protein VNK92_05705, partial [Vicinamibacterales bacterium]|nr:hypothetical protein [Vicinamibacterales bacterium]
MPRSLRDASLAGLRAALAALLLAVPAAEARAESAVLFRIFLAGGGSLVSYGEFARVDDRVVFSLPLTESEPPRLQVVSLPASAVDWAATERYADAARAAHFAATRGEIEYAELSNRLADLLNEIVQTTDRTAQRRLAEQARRMLADWSRASYGYRAADVAQLASMLDSLVSGLDGGDGGGSFDLSLVAVASPPAVPLLPRPTLRESIEQALSAARLAAEPQERIALLRAAADVLAPRSAEAWASPLGRTIAAELAAELRLDRLYNQVARAALARAAERAR